MFLVQQPAASRQNCGQEDQLVIGRRWDFTDVAVLNFVRTSDPTLRPGAVPALLVRPLRRPRRLLHRILGLGQLPEVQSEGQNAKSRA